MGKGMTLAEFRAQTTEEQRNEIYNASVSGGTEKVRQLVSDIGNGNRSGSAPAGYTSSNAGKTKVLDPDSSAYAANVKDKYKETQQPWYIVQEESAKNADTSAHAQKEKDSYVTDNILYHQWEQQQKNLKADSSAHAQAEKDDEAEKNPLFHQWKTAFDRQQEEKATRNQVKIDGLQKELDELDANSAYITTSDQYDEYQTRRKEIVDEMVALGGDGKGSGEKVGSNIKLVVDQGLTQADHRIAQTADWLFGGIAKEGKALVNSTLQTINPEWGFEDEDPWITRYNKKGAQVLNANEQEAQRRVSENELNTTVWKYAPQVVAAIPDAVLAMITGGATKGAQATTKALEAASTIAQGSKAYQTVKPIANTVENMITSPAWASAFAQSAGGSYENAIAEGASAEQATLYALANGFANATIEVGGGDEALGGIQNLPTWVQDAIRRGDSNLIAQWAKSIVNEAGEEVAQGIAEKGFRGIYSDVPLVSTEDENAVINPNRMKEEAIGGAVVSAFLGGGQTAIQAVANNTVNNSSAPIQNNVESEAPTASTDVSPPTGDNSALPTEQNVKQGGSDALNPVANPDVANAQTVAPVETQNNTAPTQETGSRGSLIQRVKKLLSGANTTDKRSNVISNMDFGETSAAIENDMVSRDELPFATVSNTTPQVLIDQAGAQNLPIIMDYSNVYLSTKKSGDLKGHYHNLGSNVMAEIPKKLENPVLMIRLGNGRINEIVQLNDKKGNPVLVSLELSAIKNLGGSFNAYNLVVTAFGAKSNYINNLVSNPDNTVLINNLPGATSQVNPQRNELPGVINEATSGSYITSATAPGVVTDNSANTFTSETAEPVARSDTSSPPSVNAEAPRVTSETAAAKPSVSNDISSDTSIPTDTQNVNGKFEGNYRSNLGKGNGTRTTQTVETINNADITTDARREQINPYVKNGRFDYIPDTNKAQVERATKAIAKNGWEASYRDFHDAVIQGKSSADLVAQGAVLMNNASNSEASAREYLDLASDYMELLHRAGETLQAGKILQQLTPEGRLYGMQKTVKRINKKLTKGQRKAIAKAREGDNYRNIDINDVYSNYEVELNETLADKYLKAETDEQRNTVISEIQQNIADQIPATFVEKWNAIRYVNMLGNFKTQERNLLGNTAMLVTQTAKNRVKAAAEVTANLFRAEDNKIERTAVFHVNKELRAEAAADFENIKDIARGEGKYSDSAQMSKDIQDKRRIFNSELLEKYRKATNWAMDAGDVIFLKANYADALGGWLKAHGIKSIEDATPEQLDRGRAYAIKEAQEATFRDDNIISKKVNQIGRNPVTEGIIPFRKTPANVAVRAVEYSPIGIAETIYKGIQTKNGNATANDVINSLSKNILGTGLAAAGYALAKAGFARGSEEDDDLDQLQKMQGKQDYAVKIGDEWISLSQLAPNSVPLYMGVMLYEALDGGGLTWEDAYKILGCLNDPLMDMSMLSGVNDALADVVTYGDDGTMIWKVLGNAMLSYLTQGINNSLVGQAEQMWEENRQTVYADKDSILPNNVQYKLGKALGKIPGVDYHQQDYVDAWGRTQYNGSVGERFFDAFLNPFYSSKDNTTEVDAELERLYKAGKNVDGFPNVLPEKASRSMEYVKGKTMTPDEYKQYSIDRGQKSLELVTDFMNSAEYDNLSDQQRAEVISDIYSLAAQQAINKVKAANGLNETTMNKYKGVSDENMPEYLAARQVFSDAALGKDGTDYSAVDAMVENFNSYSPEVQQKLMSDGYNVTDLAYADKLGQDAAIYYGCKTAIEKNADKLGGTDAAKAISVYNYMHDMGKSDAEVLAAAKAQLKPDAGGQQNATIRRMEAYMTVASKNNYDANLGEWLNLVAELHDADENSSISKGDVYAAWGNMGLGEKETYAGITRDDFYNIVKSGSNSYAGNEKYATQFDEVYAALVPSAEKTKNTLANSVSGHNTAAEDTQSGTRQYTSPIDYLLANTPYAAYK